MIFTRTIIEEATGIGKGNGRKGLHTEDPIYFMQPDPGWQGLQDFQVPKIRDMATSI